MAYIYACLLIAGLVSVFILGYKLNQSIEIECDKSDMCETCKIEFCKKREE